MISARIVSNIVKVFTNDQGNKKVVDYSGGRDLDSLVKFMETSGNPDAAGADEEADEDEEDIEEEEDEEAEDAPEVKDEL
jgi:CO dehydrogenase/acetyl-CoA synthase beta subunit